MNPSLRPVRYNRVVAVRSIGRYQVVRLLGTGGFATVYLARDDRLDTDVAVKVLAENWCNDPEISRRFLDEARLLRRCDDDRVVRVHTIEQLEDGRPYFVMDYADAGTLGDRMLTRLDEGTRFGLRESVQLSCELADCLSVVHDSGIVHRDLKPSNVLFRTGRSGQRMMLGDFGLARQMLTASGRTILAGTPEYVAPEQADPALAATVDERADVYAAAVILYELVAGVVPFGYSSLDQAASGRQGPPDLVAARGDTPQALAAVVARGMAPDPDLRYASGRAWLAALRDVAATLPPDAVVPAPVVAVPGLGRVDRPVPPGPGPGPSPLAPPPPPLPVGPPLPPSAPDHAAGGRRRKPLWPLLAGILGALALIAGAAVLIGRGGGSPSASAPTLAPVGAPTTLTPAPAPAAPTTAAPASPAPAPTGPATGLTGPAAWFAATSSSTCRPAASAEKLAGMVSAVTCTYPGIVAVFGETDSPAAAAALLVRLHGRRATSAFAPWAGGEAVTYGAGGQAGVGWDYTGRAFFGVAVSDNRASLTSWWVSTGRVVRAGA